MVCSTLICNIFMTIQLKVLLQTQHKALNCPYRKRKIILTANAFLLSCWNSIFLRMLSRYCTKLCQIFPTIKSSIFAIYRTQTLLKFLVRFPLPSVRSVVGMTGNPGETQTISNIYVKTCDKLCSNNSNFETFSTRTTARSHAEARFDARSTSISWSWTEHQTLNISP